MNFRYSLSLLFLFPILIQAQTPTWSSSAIQSGLKKLDVLGSVLYIAAHPDDENTRLLTYLAKEKLVRTGYLSLTRGDGGQNLIGKEQSEELGLIRTQELLTARNIDGAEQFFTRANDFGFSKTSKETFSIWDKTQILSDVVYVIRKFKPDVIITRFPSDARAGHGHHSASSILAQEAFVAAADPNRFPEQLKETGTWKAKRILWNNYNFAGNNNTSEDQFKIDVGVYNHLLGKSYGEIAAESRSMHKSQGFGAARQRGSSIEYFSVLKGDAPKEDIFDGVDISWARIPGPHKISSIIKNIYQNFDAEKPQLSVPALVNLYQEIERVNAHHYQNIKLSELRDLIFACSGTWVEAQTNRSFVSANTPFDVAVNAITQYPGVQISLAENAFGKSLEKNKITTFESKPSVSALTQPYWLVKEHGVGQYELQDQAELLSADGPVAHQVKIKVTIEGKEFWIARPVIYKYTDQVRGEVYQPLAITAPVTANLAEKVLLFTDEEAKTVVIKLKAFKNNASGNISLSLPEGWKALPQKQDFNFETPGEEQAVVFTISPSVKAVTGDLEVKLLIENKVYKKGIRTINYEHIPTITYFPDATLKLVKLDLKTPANKSIGYISGAGDLIPESLRQVGYTVTPINNEELLSGNLGVYDAIIAGVRAYNINENLKAAQERLLHYVNEGGVFLVQYNVNRPLVLDKIGPYPFTITRERVTEENSAVEFLLPEHRALNYPNKLSAKDFEGWIQERGLYFLSTTDSKYQLPLSMKDTDEQATHGSLAIANYGKGKFVYTGLSFFRELPAGVPGAYRLFVNLLSK
jgi:LmbE family N-acetylglucosaminyl deacetylase